MIHRIVLLNPWSRVLLEKLTGFATNQGIPRLLWNPKVHYRTHKRPPPSHSIHLFINYSASVQINFFLVFFQKVRLCSSYSTSILESTKTIFPVDFTKAKFFCSNFNEHYSSFSCNGSLKNSDI